MGRKPQFNLYKITHRETGKSYIGVTTYTVKYRWESHIRSVRRTSVKSKTAITQAIAKYGADAFDVVHIASSYSREGMLATERLLIAQEGTKAPLGYNLTDGGDRMFNPSDDVRKRLALAATGVIQSTETCQKRSEKMRLRWQNRSRKTKEEYSAIVRKAWEARRANGNDTYVMPESTKAKIVAAKKGYKHSAETIAKLKASAPKWTPEQIEAMASKMRGRKLPPRSPEWSAKISAGRRAHFAAKHSAQLGLE